MLSFDTVHALTGHLLTAAIGDRDLGFGRQPRYDLLILHDGPAADAPADTRTLTCVTVAIHHDAVAAYRGGLPDLLPDLATALRTAPGTAGTGPAAPGHGIPATAVDALADVLTAPEPGLQLLACAVAYDDITTSPTHHDGDGQALPVTVTAVRRIDAVDTDGRLYQVVQLSGHHPTVVIDDEPDPGDTPATHPGLAALLTAARQHPAATHPAATHPAAVQPAAGNPPAGGA